MHWQLGWTATAALAAFVMACSHDLTGARTNVTTGGGTDSSGVQELPAHVSVHGTVLGVSAHAPAAGSSDSLSYTPLAGATIDVYHNVITNGTASSEFVTRLISDAAGAYALPDIPGGYYLVYVTAPSGSGYGQGMEYLSATQPSVRLDLYAWAR